VPGARDIGPGTAIAVCTGVTRPTQVAYSTTNRRSKSDMNWDRIEGNWKQMKGKVKEQWGKLTDDHLDVIAGKRDQLVGRIQESYGISRDEADRQVRDWETTTGDVTDRTFAEQGDKR
jgi:uncharacterized protein YjbJ (UPF0337 family)